MKRLAVPVPVWLVRGGFLFLIMVSCSQARYHPAPSPQDACALLDSLYRHALLPAPCSLSGKARFDVNQYRLRGQFTLTIDSPGAADSTAASARKGSAVPRERPPTRMVFDFVSSAYFGSHREDVTIAMTGDDLWILDREREAYYQGADAERFIRERLEIEGDVRRVIEIATARPPACGTLEQVAVRRGRSGETIIRGSLRGESASFHFAAGSRRLRKIIWPFAVSAGSIERLEIAYGWSNDGETLESILLSIRELRWQIKLNILKTIIK